MQKKMTQAQFIENLAELCDGKDFPKDLLKVIVFGNTQYRKISDITILKKKYYIIVISVTLISFNYCKAL